MYYLPGGAAAAALGTACLLSTDPALTARPKSSTPMSWLK